MPGGLKFFYQVSLVPKVCMFIQRFSELPKLLDSAKLKIPRKVA